ncbi:MFS general substrate transporter [Metschnikowia bicuspidata var. bicuspidata NRRL YB-4993]|uniref:MFS general substrate transporter n=1 Tax=Metschnikowia bicuspidata var. bicuspidata NRRL YB-4993 TaxID=869754 RepID=A0A1A0H7R7_9ASCO|nr:MFS general substrate transporter [Metschnikowia bicuspidata var. bicuspidata NRRL YB-4993]OBA19943.1 MFS general substrate transporter [Metschnikowia bicuspidata var. bicuspidata NRRL YB-4993]
MSSEKKDASELAIKQVSSQENGISTFISPNTGKPVVITGDGDDAVAYAENYEDSFELDPEEDKKLLRKIDLYLLPLICTTYCVQFMDKQTISYGAILGLRTDLNMVGDQYSWAGSAFYFGYLFYEFIGSYTLQRFNLSKMLSIYVVLWGLILCLHAVPQYAGFVVLRVILGALESSVTPAFMIITSQWYKKEEVFFRTALWFACNGIGTLLGSGAIAYNVYKNMDSYSISPWKLIFIITGTITIALGVAIFFHIPSKPTDAWFLTEKEKKMVVERIRNNQQGFGNKHFKKEQLIETLLDRRTWILFAMGVLGNIPNGGLTNFGSILLNEKLGYSTGESLLMGMPFGAVEIGGLVLICYCYRFYPYRLFWSVLTFCIVLMATCFLAFSDNQTLQFAGYSMTSLLAISSIFILSLIASNCAGHTKKVTTSAIYLIGYCVGNLIGPQTFVSNQAPSYTSAVVAMVACFSIVIVLMLILWVDYYLDNKRRDANMDSDLVREFQQLENHEFADLTDKQNPLFRYTI